MKNHPLKSADIIDKKRFLYGLALIMSSTGAGISNDEGKCLSSLIRSLEIDNDLLNDFVEFIIAELYQRYFHLKADH
ncbi:MAG: hypothetical protein KDK90_03860 [Leptospiraceae bacterium]|nr:hypothetical protein [Leptospiraceae bacterium]